LALRDVLSPRRLFAWTGDEHPSLVWFGIVLAALYWFLESALHVVIFKDGGLASQFLTLDPHEMWKRLMVASLLIAFSLYAQRGLDHRKRIEKSLRSAHAELKQIFETASVAMRLIDRSHRVLKVNQTFARLSGVSAEEAVGSPCHEVFAGDLCHSPQCPLDRIVAGAYEVECEVDKRRRDGSQSTCVLTARPFLDEDGALLGIVESFRDITQTKAARDAAIRSEQLAALGELAAGVAHEINNPINGIINYGQILTTGERDPATVREVADQIVREGHRVADIVVNLLSFARPHQREYQVTDLTRVLRDTLTLTAAQLRKEGIRVEIEAPDDLPRVACIPQQLQQVFLNILNNSRYALDRRNGATTDHPQITITADRQTLDETPFLRLSFHDNGPGIPRESLDKVTRPFFTTKPRGKGTGLGLSISHGIVTEQGGRLVVESDEGEYTRVSVLLPAFRESEAQVRDAGPARPHAEMGEPS
jgi:PAS domain S-box-containing protein